MVRAEGNMSQKNPVTPPGIDPGALRLVAQRVNHYATPGPKIRDFFFWRDSPLVGLGLLLIHEDFCGF